MVSDENGIGIDQILGICIGQSFGIAASLYFYNPGLGNLSIVDLELVTVDCETIAIPVPPITAGITKLPDWLIRENGGCHE